MGGSERGMRERGRERGWRSEGEKEGREDEKGRGEGEETSRLSPFPSLFLLSSQFHIRGEKEGKGAENNTIKKKSKREEGKREERRREREKARKQKERRAVHPSLSLLRERKGRREKERE